MAEPSPGTDLLDESDTIPPGVVELAGASASTEPIDAGPLLDVLLAVQREAEATRDPDRAADLWARVALLAWDLGDAEASLAYTERAMAHPLAAHLLIGHALAAPSVERLAAAEAAARRAAGFN